MGTFPEIITVLPYIPRKNANNTVTRQTERNGKYMKKVKFKSIKEAFRGKGFVIALLLCVSAVGVSTYVAYNQAIDKIGGKEAATSENIYLFPAEDAVGANADTDGVPKDKPEQTEPQETQANSSVLPSPCIMPVEGEIFNAFSNGELIKSKTLEVWKTHDGIDIAAETGTDVLAMTSGTVSEVYDDPLWGVCVVIDHNDGLVGYYCSMAADVSVSAGQAVNGGEIIGKVGNTADIECKEAPHLHFGVKLNNSWTDPVEIIEER